MIQVVHPGSGSVLRIHEILERIRKRIRIRGFIPLTKGSGCGSGRQKTYGSNGSGCGSATLIRILIFYPTRIPDPGVNKAPDPGSATLLSGGATCLWTCVKKGLAAASRSRWAWKYPDSVRKNTSRCSSSSAAQQKNLITT